MKEGKIGYKGNGSNHVTLVNVDDVVDALMEIYDNREKSAGKTYNITDGVPYTQKEFLDSIAKFLNARPIRNAPHPLLAKLVGKRNNIRYDEFEFLNSDRMVSIDGAKKDLSYRPSRRIEKEGKMLVEQVPGRRS